MRRAARLFELAPFERVFLQRSINGLRAGRPICHDCRRSPLIGERVYFYERGRLVCALCRPFRKQEPLRADIVHGVEHGHTVQRVAA
jgi:hypothetical protein